MKKSTLSRFLAFPFQVLNSDGYRVNLSKITTSSYSRNCFCIFLTCIMFVGLFTFAGVATTMVEGYQGEIIIHAKYKIEPKLCDRVNQFPLIMVSIPLNSGKPYVDKNLIVAKKQKNEKFCFSTIKYQNFNIPVESCNEYLSIGALPIENINKYHIYNAIYAYFLSKKINPIPSKQLFAKEVSAWHQKFKLAHTGRGWLRDKVISPLFIDFEPGLKQESLVDTFDTPLFKDPFGCQETYQHTVQGWRFSYDRTASHCIYLGEIFPVNVFLVSTSGRKSISIVAFVAYLFGLLLLLLFLLFRFRARLNNKIHKPPV